METQKNLQGKKSYKEKPHTNIYGLGHQMPHYLPYSPCNRINFFSFWGWLKLSQVIGVEGHFFPEDREWTLSHCVLTLVPMDMIPEELWGCSRGFSWESPALFTHHKLQLFWQLPTVPGRVYCCLCGFKIVSLELLLGSCQNWRMAI